ncbi:hypothetical protein C8R43DRAFT_983811 [Mycena crocata]|nr:hypothetical protein C8R43DRAFT_983811 [Mycena crocata]
MFLKVLPLTVFPLLFLFALKFCIGNLYEAGIDWIEQECPSSETTPYRLAYIGVPSVDLTLCNLVAFFHHALTPEVLPLLTYMLSGAIPLLALPAVECFRNGRHFLLGFPILFGVLMQVMTAGAAMPIYWLIFIVTGAAQRRVNGEKTTLSSAHAQAVIFGLNIGAIVPTVCLIVLADPYVTCMWQLFPLWQFLAQSFHLFVRPPSAHHEAGYSWIRALYIGAFMIASSTHVGTLAKAKTFSGIKDIFLPSFDPLTSAAPNMKVLDLLQWDAFFAYTSTLLGTVWFARTGRQAVCIILWNILGSIVVGPGAAIAASALWRESYLHSAPAEKQKPE